MSSTSTSRCETPRRYSRSSSFSSSQGSIKNDTRVHVFVRARPLEELFSLDGGDSTTSLEFPSEKEIKLIDSKQETIYKFDHVFAPETTNKKVCDVICTPLINTVLNGYNGSFMVYGQTGAGKTFTVQSEDGLIPTTISQLFERITEDKESQYSVFLSYLQIYHERIYDLLDSSKESDLHLREHPDEGVIVEGLSECEISCTNDAESLLEFGRKQLVVAETKLVRVSSRSHSMCILRVQKRRCRSEMMMDQENITVGDSFLKGRLYLCDLAGSERLKKSGVSGDRLREAKYINSSLLELGNVIHALSVARSHHIPFRNSTLTRILKESLGGNSKASLMICVSSSIRHTSETKCSLNFGQRALRVTKSTTPNVEHLAHPYTVTKPRLSSSTLYPKIDYKALSEYLTKKLKELEVAYQNEKQTYKKMHDELKTVRKGHSKIPILTKRSRPTSYKDAELTLSKVAYTEDKSLWTEPPMKDSGNIQREGKEQPRNVGKAEWQCSIEEKEKLMLKASIYDEVDFGNVAMDRKGLNEQEDGNLSGTKDTMMSGEKMFTSMSCQTDINANYIMPLNSPTININECIDDKVEVDVKQLASNEIKIMENSFCQTDDYLDWPPASGERKEESYCKDLDKLESAIIRNDDVHQSSVDNLQIELSKTDTDSYRHENCLQLTDFETEIVSFEESHKRDAEHRHDEGDIGKNTALFGADVNLEKALDESESQMDFSIISKSSDIEADADLTKARVIKDAKEGEEKKNELDPSQGGIIYETVEMCRGENGTASGKVKKQRKDVKKVDCSENLQKSESVCFTGESGLSLVETAAVDEVNEKRENSGGTLGFNIVKEGLSRSSNLLENKEKCDEGKIEMACASVDESSKEEAFVVVKTMNLKNDDMQGRIDEYLRNECSEVTGQTDEANKGEDFYDCQTIDVQPHITLNLQAKEQNGSLEKQLIGIEKNLNVTSNVTNEGLDDSRIVSCLHMEEEYGIKDKLVGMEELCKKDVEDTEEGQDEVEISILSHYTVEKLEGEQQNSDHNLERRIENEHTISQMPCAGESCDVKWQAPCSGKEVKPSREVESVRTIDAKEEKSRKLGMGEGIAKAYEGDQSYELNAKTLDELDSRGLIKEKDNDEEFPPKSYSKEVKSNLFDTEDNEALNQKANSRNSSTVEKDVGNNEVKTTNRAEYEYVADDGKGDMAVKKSIGNMICNKEETDEVETSENKEELHDLKENEGSIGRSEYEIIDCLICESQSEDENIREAVIIRNQEKEAHGRPISIGEPRVISPKHHKQVHFEKTDEKSTNAIDISISVSHDSEENVATGSVFPPRTLDLDFGNTSLYDSSVDAGSCSPSGASVESEFSLALKEKDKLQSALKTVKNQYEDLLKEFDKIIESNTKEDSDENIPISKESYNIALKCKEELEMEIRKAREQLAIVQATHDSLSEDFTWNSSEYEYSEDSESISFDIADENKDEVRRTSTPLSFGTSPINASATSKQIHFKDNSIQTDDENISESKETKEKKPLLQERGTNTSPESEAGAICAKGERKGNEDLFAMKSADLHRLPATLPRKRGQKRRPRTLQLDELAQSDAKWVSRKGLIDKEQARRNEKLTLQAIENAELKKELLLTKLEKIRLEAMLSCVMMRVSNADVQDGFRKISINSITSSSSTLRSTTSLTNIAQNDPNSPLHVQSPFRRLNARRVTSPLGEENRSSQPRVRFDESRKTPSSASPRSSSVFGHLSLLTQSSLSPSSLDIEVSSYVSSDVSTPIPTERISPCGQDGDDHFQSPSSNKGKLEGAEMKERDINITYRGKSKLRLAACLPFRKKKKNIKEDGVIKEERTEDSYGANC